MNIQLVTHNSKLLFVLFALFLFVACKPKEKPSPATSLTDDALMDTVQRRTFNYFWDAAEPNSGLARERYHMDGEYPAGGAGDCYLRRQRLRHYGYPGRY